MEFKGTKGEWVRVGDIYTTIECKIKDVGVLPTIAVVNSTFRETEEAQANAKLIASAPDLLEALQELYNSIDSCMDLTPKVLLKAQKAIEKALL